MNLEPDLRDAKNRAGIELSKVINYRLAGFLPEGDRGPMEQKGAQQDDLSQASSSILQESDKTCQAKQEPTDLKPLLEGEPRPAVPDQMSSIIVEDRKGSDQHEANNMENFAKKTKRFQKILKVTFLMLFILVTSGVAYLLGKNNWAGESPHTLSQYRVTEPKAFVIRGQNGQLQAWIGESDGIFWIELLDASGKAQASFSLAAGDEPKLSLYNKDKEKLGEWGVAKAEPAVFENSEKTVVSTSIEESVSGPKEKVAPVKYVGSKTSNKYHYPYCKWVKLIKPERLLTFSSVREAKDSGNYVRCPTCRPPFTDETETADSGD
jgi:hypothetical protein